MKEIVEEFNAKFENASIEEVLAYFMEAYKEEIVFSSSFGAEDQVLTDHLLALDKEAKIFTLDTGRLPYETYDVMERTNLKYGIKVDVYFPDNNAVEALYKAQGINGFYESIENRKACCSVRKIEPLKRALSGKRVWITGLRSEQAVTRGSMQLVEWDEGNQIIKLNPLRDWSEEDVWNYITVHNVPYSKLHDEGYPSIGCAPCTRAVKEGEDLRAGRWWWENPEHKECGLHIKGA